MFYMSALRIEQADLGQSQQEERSRVGRNDSERTDGLPEGN